VSVALVHYFHTEVSAFDDVSPGVNNPDLSINDRRVEVETVQVECHCADAQGSEPDSDYRPRTSAKSGSLLSSWNRPYSLLSARWQSLPARESHFHQNLAQLVQPGAIGSTAPEIISRRIFDNFSIARRQQ
jgi:hypothetical protein